MPTVSVVIPVKNDAGLLDRCLHALRAQSRPADEIVVVDNDSSDDSGLVALRHGAVVIDEPRPGIPAASAAGYDRASGEIIARLDADCVPSSDWLQRVEEAFVEMPDVVAVTNGARFVDGPRLLRGASAALYLGAYFSTMSLALGHVPLFGSNFAMRRSGWLAVRNEVHRTDAMVHDDVDLSFHLGRDHVIRRDARLGMGMSMRPLMRGGRAVRLARGVHSVRVHWPAQLPWRRIARRLRSAAATR